MYQLPDQGHTYYPISTPNLDEDDPGLACLRPRPGRRGYSGCSYARRDICSRPTLPSSTDRCPNWRAALSTAAADHRPASQGNRNNLPTGNRSSLSTGHRQDPHVGDAASDYRLDCDSHNAYPAYNNAHDDALRHLDGDCPSHPGGADP